MVYLEALEAKKRREEFLVPDFGRRKTKRDLSSFRSYLTYEVIVRVRGSTKGRKRGEEKEIKNE